MKQSRLGAFAAGMLSALLCVSAAAQSVPQTFADAVKKYHPAPFETLSEAAFDAEIARLEANWSELEESGEAGFALQHLAASLGDEHTGVYDESVYAVQLPFFVMPMEEAYVVMQAQAPYAQLVGKTLESIGGVTVQTLCERLAPFVSAETDGWRRSQLAQMLCFVPTLARAGAGPQADGMQVTASDPQTGETVELTAALLYDGYDYSSASLLSVAPTLYQRGYYYANLLDESTVFIQYNVCQNNPQMPMKQFAKTLDKQIGKNVPTRVMIDLRHNSGGDSRVIAPLTNLLSKWHKKGTKLAVLIGADTFSSGVMAARDLAKIGAVLVGEPTGGVMGFGEIKTVELGDGLTLSCSTKDFSGGKAHQPMEPDVLAPQTMDDLLSGTDSAVEAAKGI